MNEAIKLFVKNVREQIDNYYFRLVIDKDNRESLNVALRLGARIENENEKYICYI